MDAGLKHGVRPAAVDRGTRVEIADLFYATPARLKFLKTDRPRRRPVADMLKRLAMAHPHVRFELGGEGAPALDYPAAVDLDPAAALARRLAQVMGRDFVATPCRWTPGAEDVGLAGLAGPAHRAPAHRRGHPPLRQRSPGARQAAARRREGRLRGRGAERPHPALALFDTCPARLVDVNVHPGKSEVRFRDPGLIRGLVVGSLKQVLAGAGHRASNTVGSATSTRCGPTPAPQGAALLARLAGDAQPRLELARSPAAPAEPPGPAGYDTGPAPPSASPKPRRPPSRLSPTLRPTAARRLRAAPDLLERPLGAARAQLHETYIVAQTRDGVVIVDQHAAHERLVYERLKAERAGRRFSRQMLLIPAVVDLDPVEVDRLAEKADLLAALGLVIEPFGPARSR